MSRVRNATEFLRLIRRARDDYQTFYQGQVEEIRSQFARNPSGQAPSEVDESLEAHMRVYFVNAFLNALNWRLELSPRDGLPNLVPEAPISSSGAGSRRFLDYLGMEVGEGKPLLVVETKRPSSRLPKRRRAAVSQTQEKVSEVVCAGLGGADLGQEWKEWLETLVDYVRSVRDQSGHVLQRVVLTNGRWFILFIDPADSFLESGSRSPENVLVYEERNDGGPDEIVERYDELFGLLEHQRVLGRTPPLNVGEIAFHLRPEFVDRVMHGLHLKYIEQDGLYSVSPVIQVSPVIFLRSRFGTWLHVESRRVDSIPHSAEQLPDHLSRVKQIATELLADINHRLGTTLVSAALESHYADEDAFEALRGVSRVRHSESSRRSPEFLVVTGDNTHYLLQEPTVTDCPHHNWVASKTWGCEFGLAPLQARSTDHPRAFFISRELHHCAHRDVAAAKASQITPENRVRCGPRSGRDFEAFCEIWHFEEHLCCRVCAFEKVCTKAQVFALPCRRRTNGIKS